VQFKQPYGQEIHIFPNIESILLNVFEGQSLVHFDLKNE
jgi:hypothetical protein